MTIETTFADLLHRARHDARMTLRMLAEGTGLSIAYLHDLEHRRRPAPSKRMCSRIAEAIADWTDMRLRLRNKLHEELRAAAKREVIARAVAKWESEDP